MIEFILFLLVIYLIASQIKVYHVSSLPKKQRLELEKRNDARSKLLKNHILVDGDDKKEEFKTLPTKNNPFSEYPYPLDLVNLIKEEYGTDQYRFNDANLIVSYKYNDNNTVYTNRILREMNSWNRLFPKYYDTNKILLIVNGVNVVSIQETEADAVVTAVGSYNYLSRTMHVKMIFYVEILRTDDILTNGQSTYILHLIDIKPVRKEEYDKKIYHADPFMTMADQLSYVERINYMHKNEKNM